MKKSIFIAGLFAAQLTSAQLYTSAGVVNPTSTPASNNVGVGTHEPHSNLEVAAESGGKITISTNGWSASSANPKYPTLEFTGYLNYPKARITATEESGNTNGSRFSILLNDNTGVANLVERFSILQNGNTGIGTSVAREKLDVIGNILAGSTHATAGINAFAIRYENGSLNNWGALRSTAATYMSFGAKADPNTANGWLSSNETLNFSKIAMAMDNDGIRFLSSPSQINPLDTPVTMKEILKVSPNGNALLQGKLEAKELKVTLTPTADFVFAENYDLPKLEAVAQHIKEKKHLPEIASASVMEKEGVNVGEFQIQLLQKIEELTLYVIEQNRQLKSQQDKIDQLEKQNTDLGNSVLEIKQLKDQFLKMKSSATH
ncbi:hypothetical protein CLU96_2462 [Chryseobacterium sp. 52]|uniref:hypothetical protein n=1 Tax=Chryseobacterium sp. 52 TaxID=2035213 RepID=UPI000C4682FC|nr:hypothetical protein [Chryseobacterium sp. 52]PIF45457.1 hypothetical protein CLU96_2462 [Chryseobacterium sp. 52]